ncbi:MAG: dephospho-CoA kinase [Acidimicrobiia bacterium]|nr:dephospho-CoA kinase [Acidimicrobiia bacterium]
MRFVGLTGGMGSGKSTVSAMLEERGAVLVDADRITRELQQPGTAVFDAIRERFGPQVIAADGTLDRQALADVVFTDPDELAALNAIVHPAVGEEIARRLGELTTDTTAESARPVILDIPLLVESGRWDLDALVVVDCDPELAVERLATGRGVAPEDARARMATQASRSERLAKADRVVHNDGDLADLEGQVDALWTWLTLS